MEWPSSNQSRSTGNALKKPLLNDIEAEASARLEYMAETTAKAAQRRE
jgi:hypothetical protein